MFYDEGVDKIELLKFVSERNLHVPRAELAWLLDMPYEDDREETAPAGRSPF